MKKTILITNIPSPYRIPLWNEIRKLTDLAVICIAKNENNRHWHNGNYPYVCFLKSYHFFVNKKDWAIHLSLPFSLLFKLIKHAPDVIIITGYDSFQYWEALLYAKLFNKKTVMWNGSTLLSSRLNNKIINRIKKYFICLFDSYYTYGTQATKYLEFFGANSAKIITGTNTIDTQWYRNNIIDNAKNTEVIKLLYVGQLIERKGLDNTILALAKITKTNWQLTIVGSGVDENLLKQLVKSYNLEDKINFVGFKQPKEVIYFYQVSDVFLMPSYNEVWGLVVNEALASGLFCLSSKYAGVSFDLIEQGVNGYTIDPKNIDDIADKIELIFTKDFDKNIISNSMNIFPKQQALKIIEAVNLA